MICVVALWMCCLVFQFVDELCCCVCFDVFVVFCFLFVLMCVDMARCVVACLMLFELGLCCVVLMCVFCVVFCCVDVVCFVVLMLCVLK